MSLMLVNPPAVEFGRSYYDRLVFTLGKPALHSWAFECMPLMLIKAAAAREGMDVITIDGMVERHENVDQTFAMMRDAARRAGPPALIGFSSMKDHAETTRLCALSKQEWPGVVTVLGNSHAVLNVEPLLKSFDVIDLIAGGDGEIAFVEMAKAVLDGRDPAGAPGVSRLEDGVVKSTPPQFRSLDDYPWASRADLPKVLALGMSASLAAKRGCPYRCSYCTTGAVSAMAGVAGYRARSVEDVVSEIEMLVRDFSIEHLTILDDLFVSTAHRSKAWALEFAELLIRRGIKVPFFLDARADSIDEEVFTALYRAGLRTVFMGLETGDEEVLEDIFNKHIPKRVDTRAKLEFLRNLGVRVVPGIIIYHPETTADELRRSADLIDYVGYLHKEFFNYSSGTYKAYLGTPLYHRYREEGYIGEWPSTAWSFRDPKAATFYRRVNLKTRARDVDFAAARTIFRQELADWENEVGAYSPSPMLATAHRRIRVR